jgi:hypothetical protein
MQRQEYLGRYTVNQFVNEDTNVVFLRHDWLWAQIYISKGGFFLFMYDIQHCFICRPSDSTVSEDAGIEPRTVATLALAVRSSRSVDLIYLH